MNNNGLSKFKLEKLSDPTAAGTTDAASGVVDMAGFDGVMLFTSIQTPAANNYLTAQSGAQSNGSDAADLAGTKVGNASTKAVAIDIYRPADRYVRLNTKRGTSTAVGEVWALKYNGRVSPPDNNTSGTILSAILASPAKGTP